MNTWITSDTINKKLLDLIIAINNNAMALDNDLENTYDIVLTEKDNTIRLLNSYINQFEESKLEY